MKSLPAPDANMSSQQRRAFALARRAAQRAIRRRTKVLRLTRQAYAKLGQGDGAMARVAQDLKTMLRMARAWSRREYRAVPWKAMLYIVAAIAYFVNPVDLIPDVLAGIGFLDDATVVAAVVRSLHAELVAFRRWENDHTVGLTAPVDEALSVAA